MKCGKCQFENPAGMNFCGECGTELKLACPRCDASNPPEFKFCGGCGHNLTSTADTAPAKDLSFDEKLRKIQKYLPGGLTEKILSQRDRIEGERRHVTIMFVDMKGFTPLTERLGPEETFSLMDKVFEILIHKIHDYEGTVNELRGDGVLALFGAPIALEDAPQRAIRSALAMHREMTKFSETIRDQNKIPPILLRIGINSGPVVVGTVGNDLRVQFTAVGDTINMAARMEQLAEPGTTYVTEETFKLTEGFFRFEALGEREVKGKEKPMKVFQVIAPSTRRTRFDVSAESGLTRFVGRERELEFIMNGYERCKSGRGQAFSMVGEAGVGKSRLLYEFRKAVSNENVTFVEGKCLSYRQGVPYHPIIDILKSACDIRNQDSVSEITEKVIRSLKIWGVDETSTLPHLLDLLTVDDSDIRNGFVRPETKKEKIIGALKRIFLSGSTMRPLVMALEDLHWIDTSSEDVAKQLVESIPASRIFLVFTFRPDFIPTWGGKSFHNQINLNRLSNRESMAMVAHLVGTEDISEELQELILEKTEGIPFYVEELVRSLKDLGVMEKKGDMYQLAANGRNVAIPATIQDTIMARVDRLPEPAKEVLQLASVIEREFGYDLIKRCTDLSEDELLSCLSALKDSELLYERGVYPHSTFIFKHALIQDVCYRSLLKGTCQKYHKKIAELMELHFSEVTRERPEQLAHHFTEAGLALRAVPYLRKAADIAIQISANLESANYLTKALELLKTVLDNPETERQELDLLVALGPVLMASEGYAASEVEKVYARIRELCQRLGETSHLFGALRGLWGVYVMRGELQTAHELGAQCLELAQNSKTASLSLWAHHMMGQTLCHLGDLVGGREHLERCLSFYDPRKRMSQKVLQDPGVACLSYKAVALWLLGYPDLAIQTGHEAIKLARSLSHPFTMAYALNITALVCQFSRLLTQAEELAEAASVLPAQQGHRYWRAWGTILKGWVLAQRGHRELGIKQISQGLESCGDAGIELVQPYFLGLLAEAYGREGQVAKGLAVISVALTAVAKTGERWCESELYRLRGELMLVMDPNNEAEAEVCFRQAIETAANQLNKSFELRAAISLSRLWQHLGKTVDADQLLAPVYGWFTEGLDTPDLEEAKIVLDELR